MRRAVAWLRTPEAVRQRCHALLALAEQDRLPHFTLHADQLDEVADFVAQVTRENYPDLAIPYHSRWRHFEIGGIDRWSVLADSVAGPAGERARVRLELCTISVLLDAGAGPDWRFHERETGQSWGRSEGLAIASIAAFRAGLFSGDPRQALRVDAEGLSRITEARLAHALQVAAANPLTGLAGRAALLRSLGAALRRQPQLFGPEARLGRLFDAWRDHAAERALSARDILLTLLECFATIWPRRPTLGGENLGDVWPHAALDSPEPGAALVPFHKLSQWLCYSLVEALEQSAIPVQELDALTGLAEYRNGGLFIDGGVLQLRDPVLANTPLPPEHAAVVEWRALTVALLDRLAPLLRHRLGRSERELPLACVLQGGTWDAGRQLARERRTDGSPPIAVLSDGSLF
ncbi:MAG TPA: URC4/urg3 family protein [Acetobacteraceae bacterium]|nr:URC4/urg3 family protein [Acetobacteraceae bacterium]